MAESGMVVDVVNPLPGTTPLGDYVRELCGEYELLAAFINAGIAMGALATFASLSAMVLVWMERKLSAHFQLRLGPMRVGWHGILQTAADGLKLFLKEGFRPKMADAFTFYLAPFLPMVGAFLLLVAVPFSPSLQVVDPELGVIYIAAVSGLSVFAIVIGSWGSNNKYSLLAGMRSGAQVISYELSLLMCMLLVVLASGETSLQQIVASQEGGIHHWWVIKLPVAGLIALVIYIIASTAELNRTPFDLAEAESELTGGFHTEYSGIAFSMFFLAEYVNMFVAAALATTFFLGGWQSPIPGDTLIPPVLWFMAKCYLIIFLFMWFRWTFPRLRIDQLMALEWKFLLPVSLFNIGLAGVLLGLGWFIP